MFQENTATWLILIMKLLILFIAILSIRRFALHNYQQAHFFDKTVSGWLRR